MATLADANDIRGYGGYLVVHLLDDAPERKRSADGLDRIQMSGTVRASLIALRIHLIAILGRPLRSPGGDWALWAPRTLIGQVSHDRSMETTQTMDEGCKRPRLHSGRTTLHVKRVLREDELRIIGASPVFSCARRAFTTLRESRS
jgi:hypothetical protein